MPVKPDSDVRTPEAHLQSYIDKLEPKQQKLFKSLRDAFRKRFPTANELAYDYGFALVIGFAPAENGIDAIVALRASATGVSLYFNQGPRLPDPKRLLRGSAKLTRFIEIDSVNQLADPDVEALIAAAVTHATVPLPAKGKGTLIIKSDSAKKAARKKSAAKKSVAKKSVARKSAGKKSAGKKSSKVTARRTISALHTATRAFATLAMAIVLAACGREAPPSHTVAADPAFCAQIQTAGVKLSEQLGPLASRMRTSTGVYPLEEGDVSMVARAWLTEAAEHTIDIQYFIFSADNVGLIAVDYLLRAADRGVHVRVLVDDFMLEADADELLALDAHPNIEIHLYNPSANIGKNLPTKLFNLTTDFRGFNQRMHNKTFIVDGQVAITGGRNIADEYFDYDHEYNFRDRDVLLLGGASASVQRSFNLFWENALSAPIASLVKSAVARDTATMYRYLHNYACDPRNFWPQVRERIKLVPVAFKNILESGALVWSDSVSFVTDAPGKNAGTDGVGGGGASTDELVRLIKGAHKSVTIQSPYLVTTGVSQNLFREAIARGVRVRILTNSLASTDNLEAFSGYQREREALLKIGVEIYEFKPDAAVRRQVMTGALQTTLNYAPTFGLHAKSMVVDDNIAVIGTFNLDPRSANLNTECLAVIRDARIAGNLQHAMDVDMQPENAWHTTSDFNPDGVVGTAKRIKVWLRRVVPKAVL